MDNHTLAGEIKRQARKAGFDLCGIAPAEPSAYRDYYRQWLDEGRSGSMHWMEGRFDERTDPGVYVPGARSIICVAMNYHVALEPVAAEEQPHHGKVARYALGDDYHELMKKRLHALADWIRQQRPEAVTRACVDTAPVMEKEMAARAGIGWIGKNTLVIHPQIGSWVLLGEVITTLALPADEPAVDRCGTCQRCLEACPTDALTAPYQMDARQCISYLTIERREEIAPALAPQVGEWVYGCDICQEVCPWNRKAPEAAEPALTPRFPSGTLDLRQVLQWEAETYRRTLKGSAMKRVKLPVLQRNAALVLANRQAAATRQEEQGSNRAVGGDVRIMPNVAVEPGGIDD
jgi:epoxyqueuosine reductase